MEGRGGGAGRGRARDGVLGLDKVCSACRLTFGHLAEHRDHCRLDLHRYNLKVGLRGRPPLTEGEFEGILEQLEGDEEEEISGSEEEEEEAEEEGVSVMARESRLVLETADGRAPLPPGRWAGPAGPGGTAGGRARPAGPHHLGRHHARRRPLRRGRVPQRGPLGA